jgi:hypothetical protein
MISIMISVVPPKIVKPPEKCSLVEGRIITPSTAARLSQQ